jgi:uncharacterized protein (TIGR03089 family)
VTGLPDLLDGALRQDPARPLITFYDDATGERAELSVTTFATWVAKTANLLRDDLDAQPGGTVAIDLPGHWQAAVWLQASWTLGLHVRVDGPRDATPDVRVTTYDGDPTRATAGSGDVVVLGLGLLGLPRRDAAAPAWATVDYDREIAGHGDRYVPDRPADPDAPALTTADGTWTGAQLTEAAREAQPPPGRALLLTEPLATLTTVLGGLLVPLVSGCTAVLCRHVDNLLLASRVEQEEVVMSVTSDTPGTPRWMPFPERGKPRVT